MANEVRLIDAAPLIADGWVLERHGISNCLIGIKSLADVPAVDPESLRPKGRWENRTEQNVFGSVDMAVCSNCGDWFVLNDWTFDEFVENMRFCPNCGAKMEG